MRFAKYIIVILLMIVLPTVVNAYDGPLVVDDANLLDGRQLLELEYDVQDANSKLGINLVILTVESLNGQKVSTYAKAIMQVWGIGEKDKANGLLLLIVQDQMTAYFEAGKDVGDPVTPELLDRIKNELLEPALKEKQYMEGLTEAVAGLTQPWREPKNLTVFLWIIPALIVAALAFANTLNRKTRRCPNCENKIRPSVIRCPHCLAEIRPAPNDPCPCGSGKTYKDCCLDTHLDGRESFRIQFLRFLDVRYLLSLSTQFGGFTAGGAGELSKQQDKSQRSDISKTIGGW